jgi:hypothetical protein
MRTHVKIVGWLWIIWGFVSILMEVIGLGFINLSGNVPNAQDAILITSGSICLFVPGIIADFLAGYGLLKFKNWARILVIVLAVVNLIFLCTLILPLALAIYTLVIMFNKETVTLFKAEDTATE